MGAKTGINWTDATWNPVSGCRLLDGRTHDALCWDVAHA